MLYIVAYFGPETTLPVVSGIMAVVGFAIMMGRNTFTILGRWARDLVSKLPGQPSRPEPASRSARKISDLVADESARPLAPARDLEPSSQN